MSHKHERRLDMASATMTIRLDSNEKDLIAEYARAFGTSASEFMRRSALERIEDDIDLEAWKAAKAEFDGDPVTYSNDDVMHEFGLR